MQRRLSRRDQVNRSGRALLKQEVSPLLVNGRESSLQASNVGNQVAGSLQFRCGAARGISQLPELSIQLRFHSAGTLQVGAQL